jgi:murein DD-endopeptidase MepM/ murein hydrolase activator NlpD
LIICAAAVYCCTAAPKYRGRTERRRRPPAQKRPAAVKQKLPVLLSHPVRNFSVSRISSRFGLRRDPRYNREEFHYGIDIRAKRGEKALAAAPGRVTFAGRQSGFGKLVILDHGERCSTVYGHLSTFGVRVGQTVARGEPIGTVGSTGNATGTHLHFEVRKAGKALNPLDYL